MEIRRTKKQTEREKMEEKKGREKKYCIRKKENTKDKRDISRMGPELTYADQYYSVQPSPY